MILFFIIFSSSSFPQSIIKSYINHHSRLPVIPVQTGIQAAYLFLDSRLPVIPVQTGIQSFGLFPFSRLSRVYPFLLAKLMTIVNDPTIIIYQ
jgi:hypothetical protein